MSQCNIDRAYTGERIQYINEFNNVIKNINDIYLQLVTDPYFDIFNYETNLFKLVNIRQRLINIFFPKVEF